MKNVNPSVTTSFFHVLLIHVSENPYPNLTASVKSLPSFFKHVPIKVGGEEEKEGCLVQGLHFLLNLYITFT